MNQFEEYLFRHADGFLPDGRPIEFKASINKDWDKIVRVMVSFANFGGGIILLGVGEVKDRLSIVGIEADETKLKAMVSLAVARLTIGLKYSVSIQMIQEKYIGVITIEQADTTAYFSRLESSPYRQIEYEWEKDDKGIYTLVNKTSMQYQIVYKYMTFDSFLISLYTCKWRFFEPNKWDDKFERRFYCADYLLPSPANATPQLFATCVTRAKNSEAAWKVYSHGQGLGAHCVQLELNVAELRKQLRASGMSFEERMVDYIPEPVILMLHNKKSSNYTKYFDKFTFKKFLDLLALKRDAYSYEKEVRLFVIPKVTPPLPRSHGKKCDYRDIAIDWKSVINKVRVDKKCSDAELVSIQQACFNVGIDPRFLEKNKQKTVIGGLLAPAGCKTINFELYDIDEMPGSQRIKIK